MRSRSIALVSLAAVSGLVLAGCSSDGGDADAGTSPSAAAVVESSYAEPAAAGERVGQDGDDLQVWSNTVPDAALAEVLGDPADGTTWVSVYVGQYTATEGQTDADVAPVLRSSTDESFEATAVSTTGTEVPMSVDRLYTYSWAFEVPEDLADATSLILCTSVDENAGCSAIAE